MATSQSSREAAIPLGEIPARETPLERRAREEWDRFERFVLEEGDTPRRRLLLRRIRALYGLALSRLGANPWQAALWLSARLSTKANSDTLRSAVRTAYLG